AAPGARLTLATMFVQSNDFFYAPSGSGIELFENDGTPVTGDITSSFLLWDAGTEIDQEPGPGADQAPRQSGPDTGASDPDNTVRLASDDFGNLPAVADVIQVTIDATSETDFTVTIENVSNASSLSTSGGSVAVPLSPGVFVVHTEDDPLFTDGQPDRGEGWKPSPRTAFLPRWPPLWLHGPGSPYLWRLACSPCTRWTDRSSPPARPTVEKGSKLWPRTAFLRRWPPR
ncbi:MAG: spondin domain-containing protein, partial [Acidimicrobiia bacterium]|nr:spondin domain-containing protein [Acidimicrobiia bacterium]